MRIPRLVAIGWLMHFKQLAKAPFKFASALLVHVHFAAGSYPSLALLTLVTAISCTADGASLSSVSSLLLTELAIGATYATAGYLALRYFELQAPRHATLGLA